MNKLLIRVGKLPIGNTLDYLLIAALIVLVLLLTGCASTPPKEIPLTAAEAKAEEMKAFALAMGSAKDAETQRLLIFAQFAAKGNQAPVFVDHGNRSIGDAVYQFLDRTTERLFSVAPAYFAYKGQVRAAETTKSVAEINRDVSLGQFASTTQIAIAGINGSAATGLALANRPIVPQAPTTQVTVTGNSGPVLLGGGTQNSGSFNPVNPSPVVCLPGTTTTAGTCSR
jgi:hypothetical protein